MREIDALCAADPAAAIARLKQELAADPGFYAGWIRLGYLLYTQNAYADALRAVYAAEQCDPLQAEFRSIQASMQRRDLAGAGAAARRMLEAQPGHPRAVFTLAHIAQASGDDASRIAVLEAGTSASPANLFLRSLLLSAQEESGAYGAALETARQIAGIEGGFQGHWGLANILLRFGQNAESLAACDRAERAAASDPLKLSEIDLVRGQIYRILGERGRGEASMRAALLRNPLNGAAWWALADMKTVRFPEADTAEMRALMASPQASPDQKTMAAFSLARASEVEGDWDRAMALYHTANQLRPGDRFDPQAFSNAISRLAASITPQALAAQAPPQPGAPVPIFIVGLPRSGSTLLEQILASHSEIEGTHELPVLPSVKRRAHRLCVDRFGGDYLANLGRIGPEDLAALGQRYLSESALFRAGNTRIFTDKMPFNFEHVGLIHKILPHAAIIDIRRNPLDCGLSLYKQYFTQGSTFSYSLEGIGRYYNGYLRLMDHWDAVLPGKILHVQYEELVAAPEREIRRLLEHIGVPFEAACLEFHTSGRAVRTASSEQVRQPLYTQGIGAWRRAGRHLDALRTALGPGSLARFDPYLRADYCPSPS